MTDPQQPELRRSGQTVLGQDEVLPDVAEETPSTRTRRRAAPGPVPPENRPDHHPETEQDKPDTPPPAATRRRGKSGESDEDRDEPGQQRGTRVRFPLQFDARLAPLAAAFGVLPSTAYVDVDGSELHIRFGPWSLRTPVDNVREVTRTGPYRWWKIAGPPRLSLADRGITFATTAGAGVCIRFHEPVPAALPTSALRHPAATVTVATPTALTEALSPPH